MRYKKSIFTHKFSNGSNKIILFNASNLALLSGTKEDFEFYDNLDSDNIIIENHENEENIKVLIDNKFIVPQHINEIEEETRRRKIRRKLAKEIRKNTIGFLRVSLTEYCNLSCKYCFVNDIFKTKNEMSKKNLLKLLNWFLDINGNINPLVQYFGGEPLLRFDDIVECHNILQRRMNKKIIKSFREEIVTNGTLMTEDMAEYFVKNNIEITFSIDGWKSINDKNRIDSQGNGSYDRIVKGMELYKKCGGKLSAIITPTEDNMPIFEDIVKFLHENLNCETISINTPQPTLNGWDIDGAKFAKAMMNCLEYCNEKEVKINHPGNNIVFLINNKIPQTNSCMNLTYGQPTNTWGIYVTSAMKISKCVVECDERCSKNFENFTLDNEYLEWHFEDSINSNCMRCPGLNICGGGCSVENLLLDGDNNIEKCKFFKLMIPWVIERYSN